MFRCLNLLLLFCFINYSETHSVPVAGGKGGNITLLCEFEFEANQNLHTDLIRESEYIDVCPHQKNCSRRVFRERSCDVSMKNLSFSDAGKYTLRVHYKNDQEVRWDKKERKYQLQILGEISVNTAETSVKKGEDLKLDVLLSNTYKVERNSGSGWTELWTRGHGVNSDRLTDHDGKLIIHEFTVTDTGTYRVLDSNNQTLITVTVTESDTGSKGKLDTDDDHKPNEQDEAWIIVLSVCGVLLVLAGIIFAVYKICHRQHRNPDHDPVPMEEL